MGPNAVPEGQYEFVLAEIEDLRKTTMARTPICDLS